MRRAALGSARGLVALAVTLLLAAACGGQGRATSPPPDRAPLLSLVEQPLGPRPLVGAHYYHWYPANWSIGTLRAQLDPPQPPELGWYDSTDPKIAEQHIAWASAYGLDFFTLDWWPTSHQANQAAIDAFLGAPNLADIDFAIFYETWDLGFDGARGWTDLDRPGVREAFVADMVELADRYFSNPSYLRVGGQPVVFLYLTRVLVGDVEGAMADARAAWAARGYDPFVVADEIFWTVTRSGRRSFSTRPQVDRIRLFDAITAYNPYSSGTASHAGYSQESRFLPDVADLYQRYADATGGDVPVVPDVLPGYNDRGVRPSLEHYSIPRARAPGAGEGTFLLDMLTQVADRWRSPAAPLVLVTSWNEWNEDTAIEPVVPATGTTEDQASDGISRTEGVALEGYGRRYLEVLRDHYVAVSGRVTGPDGRVTVGRRVTASVDGRIVAEDTTDRYGRFTLSRAHVGTGPVRIDAGRLTTTVTPDPVVSVVVDLAG